MQPHLILPLPLCNGQRKNKIFHELKHALMHEIDGYATGILMQKHGSHYRPVVYYSSRLSPVVLGMAGCLRSITVVASMIEKPSPIVLGCVVHVTHSVLHIFNTSATQHVTAEHRSGYKASFFPVHTFL